jgi:predicted nucleic acid-binding protein
MRIFVDANILVSVLNKEYPLYSYSARVLSLADRQGVHIFTSPVCLAIAFYFAEKKSGAAAAKKKICLLTEKIHIAVHSKEDIPLIAANNKIEDFEDGLEYYAALHEKCNYIITENTDDFYFSDIAVYKPGYFLLNLVGRN